MRYAIVTIIALFLSSCSPHLCAFYDISTLKSEKDEFDFKNELFIDIENLTYKHVLLGGMLEDTIIGNIKLKGRYLTLMPSRGRVQMLERGTPIAIKVVDAVNQSPLDFIMYQALSDTTIKGGSDLKGIIKVGSIAHPDTLSISPYGYYPILAPIDPSGGTYLVEMGRLPKDSTKLRFKMKRGRIRCGNIVLYCQDQN
ncbi:MAG: hypothetical protein J0L99_13145 [Chitinophagales bacterium]|nr:hypothetical protein [Chitinophagales bacterium]